MIRPLAGALLACFACAMLHSLAGPSAAGPDTSGASAMVLGVVQDGGLPHLGCVKECCSQARKDPSKARRVASIALRAGTKVFLIDATPDIRSQIATVLGEEGLAARPARSPVDGILITHAHIGHYAGLIYLGREAMAADAVPVFATDRLWSFLAGNGPWRRLVDNRHIVRGTLSSGERGAPVELAPGLSIEPIRVPHREEDSDVLGFLVKGPSRRLLYIPDIDDWSRWDRDIAGLVRSVDVALLDGTFHAPSELGARSMSDVPHPLVPSTMDRLEPMVKQGRRVIFIHMNHTNPILQPGTPERRELERRGFEVAQDGMVLPL